MSILNDKLQAKIDSGRKGLVVYLTAGYPDLATSCEAILAAAAAGADIIEIGIPFSDPIADGPVIQKAATLSLQGGTTTAKILDMTRKIRSKSDVPLAVMTYVNTILNYGAETFIRDFGQAGVSGIIVPDLPLEEAGMLLETCNSHGVDLIQFIAPTSTAGRIEAICRQAGGFLYCISTTGVTGGKVADYQPAAAAIAEVRKYTAIPVAIGFGISTPEDALEAARYSDAVIVGSAIIRELEANGVTGVDALVRSIRLALDKEGG